MKRTFHCLAIAGIATVILAGCTVTAPYFTTVDKVILLKPNMNYDQVKEKLGIPAYDMYIKDRDNKSIYMFYFKHLERKEKADRLTNKAFGTSGEEVAVNQAKLYCIFDKEGKLESIISDDGRGDAVYLQLMDNSFREIANKPADNYILPKHFDKASKKSAGSIIKGGLFKKKK